jgi:hypothetical protein
MVAAEKLNYSKDLISQQRALLIAIPTRTLTKKVQTFTP